MAVTTSTIPFFPPDLFEAERAVILDLIEAVATDPAQRFMLGERCAAMESAIAEASGAAHVVACASGTAGLALALAALGIERGDEVIVPAFCCQPVASTVIDRGATPVFADVDPWLMTLAPESSAALVGPRTKAIMPAHVFSVMADMARFRELSELHGLRLIEDAAVAQGAEQGGLAAGRWGEIGVYSFFQVKALGTIGEGGVVLTDDQALADACRELRNHGQRPGERFVHRRIGYNYRLDEIVAGFQLHRLPTFHERLSRRAAIADYYDSRFSPLEGTGCKPPPPLSDGRCYYVYSLLVDQRDDLRSYLAARGIGSHVYYPVPLPHQPAFRSYAAPDGEWPHAEAASRRNLALPIYPHLSDGEIERIADCVVEFFT